MAGVVMGAWTGICSEPPPDRPERSAGLPPGPSVAAARPVHSGVESVDQQVPFVPGVIPLALGTQLVTTPPTLAPM